MSSGTKILVDVDLGRKGVEKTDMYVYLDGKLIQTHIDKSYDDIRLVAGDLTNEYKGAEVEVICEGEDLFGRSHRWHLET